MLNEPNRSLESKNSIIIENINNYSEFSLAFRRILRNELLRLRHKRESKRDDDDAENVEPTQTRASSNITNSDAPTIKDEDEDEMKNRFSEGIAESCSVDITAADHSQSDISTALIRTAKIKSSDASRNYVTRKQKFTTKTERLKMVKKQQEADSVIQPSVLESDSSSCSTSAFLDIFLGVDDSTKTFSNKTPQSEEENHQDKVVGNSRKKTKIERSSNQHLVVDGLIGVTSANVDLTASSSNSSVITKRSKLTKEDSIKLHLPSYARYAKDNMNDMANFTASLIARIDKSQSIQYLDYTRHKEFYLEAQQLFHKAFEEIKDLPTFLHLCE